MGAFMVTAEERQQLKQALESRLAATRGVGHQEPALHEIFETFWAEWELLGSQPLEKQQQLKLEFLKLCLKFIPEHVVVWDDATGGNVPYRKKHLRNIGSVEQRISSLPAGQAVEELDKFIWDLRLRGDGFGVLHI